LTGRTPQEVRGALERANGSVKLAVLVLHGCSVEEATRALDKAAGRLRTALKDLGSRAGTTDDVTIGEEVSPDLQDNP